MHQVMLGDKRRLDAYDLALKRVLKPGDVVVDVGAGTLVLSLLALRRGASHVYAIEAEPDMAALALRIILVNGLRDRITLFQGDARSIRVPERADVLVCEMMGNLGPEEQMAEIVEAAARRLLKPNGPILPERLVTHIQAIGFDREGWGVWCEDFRGYSLRCVQDYAPPGAQLHFFSRPPVLLSAPRVVADASLGDMATQPGGHHRIAITKKGQLQAIAMYFTATLSVGVTLSNFPSYSGCNWAVWIWPVRHTKVAPGDVLHVEIRRPTQVRIATDWALDCRIEPGAEQ